MVNFQLMQIQFIASTSDGATIFSEGAIVSVGGIVSHNTWISFNLKIGSLAAYQEGLDNTNEICWYTRNSMILQEYNKTLIEEKIRNIITQANTQNTRYEAFVYLCSFMDCTTDIEDFDLILDYFDLFI